MLLSSTMRRDSFVSGGTMPWSWLQRLRSTTKKARWPRCFAIQALRFSTFLSPRKTVRSAVGHSKISFCV
jgi:hypothetical protein